MLTSQHLNALSNALSPLFVTRSDFDRYIVDLEKKVASKLASPGRRSVGDFSISRWIRGCRAASSLPRIQNTDAQQDLEYFTNINNASFTDQQRKDLSTSATPGSYLVPTIQANEIVAMLADYGTLRRAGVRIIPMVGIEKLTMPSALSSPTVAWLGENTAQSASDANLGQLTFDLKTARSLTPIPNELLATSVPAIDMILTEILAQGFGEAEDKAFFSTLSQTNGPTSLYASVVTGGAGTITVPGGGLNGTALTYQDLLSLMGAARKAKAVGPFVWLTNPHVLYDVISGLLDKNSRPIFDPNQIVQKLFGWPIFDTTWIAQDQTVGSTASCSYLVFTNPRYLFIAEPAALEIATSAEFAFDKNQTMIRGVHREDFGFAPPLGIAVCKGIV